MSQSKSLKDFSINELFHEIKKRENPEGTSKEIRIRETNERSFSFVSNKPSNEGLHSFETGEIIDTLNSKLKAIYEVDNRMDIKDVTNEKILEVADSVAALFTEGSVIDNGDGSSTLKTKKFGNSYNLCSTEKFRNQPIGAFCSGFLVAPNIIATAGHCVTNENISKVRFVFGFRMVDDENARTIIKNSEIYKGVKLINRQQNSSGSDWSLVQLDRDVTDHKHVQIRRTGKIKNNEPVYVIGHPVGLPTKFADGATVQNNEHDAYFVSNLDTYGGNSGSPVFNSRNEVEGVLVRGAEDFVMNGNCRVSLICSPASGCKGEDCTRTTEFAKDIPIVDM